MVVMLTNAFYEKVGKRLVGLPVTWKGERVGTTTGVTTEGELRLEIAFDEAVDFSGDWSVGDLSIGEPSLMNFQLPVFVDRDDHFTVSIKFAEKTNWSSDA